jgi:hypothetical protein
MNGPKPGQGNQAKSRQVKGGQTQVQVHQQEVETLTQKLKE